MVGLVVGVGCGAEPVVESRPDPDRATAIAAAESQVEVVAAPTPVDPATAGSPPEVVLVWHNVGHLYQSFFAHTELVTPLSQALAGRVRGPVNVHVRWDDKAFVGTIRLRVLPNTLISPALGTGDVVPLHELAPLTEALSTYRSAAGSRFDVRLASFKVAIESFSGARHCVIPVAGRPPDGTLVSPCVEINGEERCGTPGPTGVSFAPDVAADLRACLQPKG